MDKDLIIKQLQEEKLELAKQYLNLSEYTLNLIEVMEKYIPIEIAGKEDCYKNLENLKEIVKEYEVC